MINIAQQLDLFLFDVVLLHQRERVITAMNAG
jgi:hypothetical protein